MNDGAKSTYKELKKYVDSDELPSSVSVHDVDALPSLSFTALIEERAKQGALDDAQRLLYVALTRAAKSLQLCLMYQGNDKHTFSSETIFSQLYDVLLWDHATEPTQASFDFGGSAPALVHHEVLLEHLEVETESAPIDRSFVTPKLACSASCECAVDSERFDVISYSSISSEQSDDVSLDDEDLAAEIDRDDAAAPVTSLLGLHEEDNEPFIDDLFASMKQEVAVALGTAFHRLAQAAIESRTAIGQVPPLDPGQIEAQIVKGGLTREQAKRLRCALTRWFGSDPCARFFSMPCIHAEVPFMISLESEEGPVFLEGEIDGLAFDPNDPAKRALFIDYKTGGSDEESAEQLYEKHLLQAQCYALALMRQGFREVEAYFIRVERACPADPTQPQVVPYTFSSNEHDALEEVVVAAYRVAKG